MKDFQELTHAFAKVIYDYYVIRYRIVKREEPDISELDFQASLLCKDDLQDKKNHWLKKLANDVNSIQSHMFHAKRDQHMSCVIRVYFQLKEFLNLLENSDSVITAKTLEKFDALKRGVITVLETFYLLGHGSETLSVKFTGNTYRLSTTRAYTGLSNFGDVIRDTLLVPLGGVSEESGDQGLMGVIWGRSGADKKKEAFKNMSAKIETIFEQYKALLRLKEAEQTPEMDTHDEPPRPSVDATQVQQLVAQSPVFASSPKAKKKPLESQQEEQTAPSMISSVWTYFTS